MWTQRGSTSGSLVTRTRWMGLILNLTLRLSRRRSRRQIARCTMDPSLAICATNTSRCLRISSFRDRFSMRRWQQCHLSLIRSTSQVPTSDSVRSASVCQSSTRLIRSRSQMRLLRTSFLTDLVSLCLPGLGFGRLTTPGREVKSSPITISCSMSACAVKWDGLPTTSKPGTGKSVSVTLATRAKIYRLVRSASPVCGRRCWIPIRPRRLIPS